MFAYRNNDDDLKGLYFYFKKFIVKFPKIPIYSKVARRSFEELHKYSTLNLRVSISFKELRKNFKNY